MGLHYFNLSEQKWIFFYSSGLFTTPIWNIFNIKPPKLIYQEQNVIFMVGIFNPPLVDAEKKFILAPEYMETDEQPISSRSALFRRLLQSSDLSDNTIETQYDH